MVLYSIINDKGQRYYHEETIKAEELIKMAVNNFAEVQRWENQISKELFEFERASKQFGTYVELDYQKQLVFIQMVNNGAGGVAEADRTETDMRMIQKNMKGYKEYRFDFWEDDILDKSESAEGNGYLFARDHQNHDLLEIAYQRLDGNWKKKAKGQSLTLMAFVQKGKDPKMLLLMGETEGCYINLNSSEQKQLSSAIERYEIMMSTEPEEEEFDDFDDDDESEMDE